MRNAPGLEIRLAKIIVCTLLQFESPVRAEANGESTDGKSLLGLLSLCIAYGDKVKFTATGADAAPALNAVQRLFVSRFGARPARAAQSGLVADGGEVPFMRGIISSNGKLNDSTTITLLECSRG
jgi:phosphotransferase system HPr (HPr) family protein